jgi:predicted transposase/invertase (TIGR01784 family)
MKMDVAIQKAAEKMEYVTIDKEALRAYQMREMALSDWTSGLNHARETGWEEGRQEGEKTGLKKGRQEGRQEGKWEVAVKMRRRGEPMSQIAEDTGLSVEDIAKL